MLYEEEMTQKIIAAAIEVHRILGPGLLESSYERCLCHELNLRKMPFQRQKSLPISYKGIKIGNRRVDFFVEEKVMVEIKAVIQLEDVHLAQAINYLEAYGLEVGLLINFGANKDLEWKRMVLTPEKPARVPRVIIPQQPRINDPKPIDND